MTASAIPAIYPFRESFRAPYDPQVPPELLEEVSGMSETQKDALRAQAKKDRYFLAHGILGYADVNPYTHGPMCRALEDRSRNRRMFLAPRGHLKTTVCTITDCVGDALTDPEECRILIVNEIEDNAIGFLSEIKAHFENNELLHELFPELIPKKFGGPGSKWSGWHACLNRHTAYKEWTWTAAGVGKALASNHYTKIKCDDLIGFESRESPANMKYAIKFAKTLEPLLIDMDVHFMDFVGTRWAIYDLYRAMLRAYKDEMAYFAREDIELVPPMSEEMLRRAGFRFDNPAEIIGTLQPIFPKKFSLKRLRILSEIDPVLYYAQYKNNPIADGIKDFNSDAIQTFQLDSQGSVVYRDHETGILCRWARAQLDIVMCADPNGGDLTAEDLPAIVVAAFSPEDQVFVLETWSKRVQPDSFVEMIFEIWQRWEPRVCGIEKAGQQTTTFYFKKLTRDLGVYVNVQDNKPANRKKPERIRKGLQPIINQHKLFLRKEQSVLKHQVRFHPDLDNDDEIDALEYTTEIAIRPSTLKEREDEDEAVKKVLAARNRFTGYGR